MSREILSDGNSQPVFDRNATTEDIQRRIMLMSMDWDSLTDDEKLEAFPGLGYN